MTDRIKSEGRAILRQMIFNLTSQSAGAIAAYDAVATLGLQDHSPSGRNRRTPTTLTAMTAIRSNFGPNTASGSSLVSTYHKTLHEWLAGDCRKC